MIDYDKLGMILRKEQRSRRGLAVEIGASIDTVESWFRRKTDNVPISAIALIADALNVPATAIVRDDVLALLKEQDTLPGIWFYDRPGHYKCSVCGAQWGQAALMMKHCPDCGRRMEV